MSGFQRGDVVFSHQGRDYQLRLSLGALARLDQDFAVSGPLALANKLRTLNSASEAQALLACLLVPPLSPRADTLAAVADIPPENFLPAIADLFERNFASTQA